MTTYLFFSYALAKYQILFAIVLFFIFFSFIIKNKKIKYNKSDLIIFLCTILNIISCYKTENIIYGITFTFILIALGLVKVTLQNKFYYKNIVFKLMFIFSFIHLISTILQILFPNLIMNINKEILSYQSYRVNYSQLIRGQFAGITGQAGANAFYITIFIAILISYWLTKKKLKKFYNVLLLMILIISIVGILATNKRGMLLCNFVAIAIIISISIKNKNRKKILIFLLIFFIVISITYLFFYKDYYISYIIEEDLSSGRIDIYKKLIEMIKNKFWFGNGAYSVETLIGIKGHNIYLQLWAEMGIVGLVAYLSLFLGNIKIAIYNYKLTNNKNYKIMVAFSVYIQIVFLVYGMVGNPLYDYFILGIYFISVAMAINLDRKMGDFI